MTRQDYEAMASELNATRAQLLDIARKHRGMPGLLGITPKGGADSLEACLFDYTCTIARVMAADNPLFDTERFIAAAGFRL